MKDMILVVGFVGVILFASIMAKCVANRHGEQSYSVRVTFQNGDTSTVIVKHLTPRVNGNGCLYDGENYRCGVRQIDHIKEIGN